MLRQIMASVASPYYPSGCSATGRNETEDPPSSVSVCNSHIRRMSYIKSSIPSPDQPAAESSISSDGTSDSTGSKCRQSEKSVHEKNEKNAVSNGHDSTGRKVFPDTQSDKKSHGKEIECLDISALSTAVVSASTSPSGDCASSPLHKLSCVANASTTQPPSQNATAAATVASTLSHTKSLTSSIVSSTTHDAFAAVSGSESPSGFSCTATAPSISERTAATAATATVRAAAEHQKQQTPRTKKKMLLLAAESTVRRANSTPSFLHYACKNRTLPLKSNSSCNPTSSHKSPLKEKTCHLIITEAPDTQSCQQNSSVSSAATAAVDSATTSESRPAAATTTTTTTEAACLSDGSDVVLCVSSLPTSSPAVSVASSPPPLSGVVTAVSTDDIIAGAPSAQKQSLRLSPASADHKVCLSAYTTTTTPGSAACSVDNKACLLASTATPPPSTAACSVGNKTSLSASTTTSANAACSIDNKAGLSVSTTTSTAGACPVVDACSNSTDAGAMLGGFCVYESSVATCTLLSDRKSPLAAALLSLTKRNMQELYDSVNFLNKGWRDETKRRELQHRDARYLLVFGDIPDSLPQQRSSADCTFPSQASSTYNTASITATGKGRIMDTSAAAQRTTMSASEPTVNSEAPATAEPPLPKATGQPKNKQQATPASVSSHISTPEPKRGNRNPLSCSDKYSKNSIQPSHQGTNALTPQESTTTTTTIATQHPAAFPISAEKDDSELLHQLPLERLVGFLHFRFEVEEGHAVAYIYELQVERAYQRLSIGRRLMLLLELACRGFNRQMQKEYQERQQQIASDQRPQQGDGDKKQQQGQETSQQQQRQGEHPSRNETQKQPLGVTPLNNSRQASAHEVDRKQNKRCSVVEIEKRRNRQQEKVVQQPLRIEKLMCTVIKANKGAVRFYKQFCKFETDESDPSNFTSSVAGWSSSSNSCSNRQSEDLSQAATKKHTPTRGKDAGKAARRLLQTFQKEEEKSLEEDCEYEILKKML